MAWSFGLFVVAVRVVFNEEKGWHGGTDIAGSTDHLPLVEKIAGFAAGKTAEKIFNCPAHETAWLKDFGEIAALLKANGISQEELWPRIADAGATVRAILETHRDKVLKLTARLVERGHVDAAEFLRLMNGETETSQAN